MLFREEKIYLEPHEIKALDIDTDEIPRQDIESWHKFADEAFEAELESEFIIFDALRNRSGNLEEVFGNPRFANYHTFDLGRVALNLRNKMEVQ